MSATRKLERSGRSKQEREQLRLAKLAKLVAEMVFDGPAPTLDALKIRVAIGLNFVLLCRKHKTPDIARAVKMVKTGWVEYDKEKDGPSEWMRWYKDVLDQRVLEGAWLEEQKEKKSDGEDPA